MKQAQRIENLVYLPKNNWQAASLYLEFLFLDEMLISPNTEKQTTKHFVFEFNNNGLAQDCVNYINANLPTK